MVGNETNKNPLVSNLKSLFCQLKTNSLNKINMPATAHGLLQVDLPFKEIEMIEMNVILGSFYSMRSMFVFHHIYTPI